jgi:hypothetical protein
MSNLKRPKQDGFILATSVCAHFFNFIRPKQKKLPCKA